MSHNETICVIDDDNSIRWVLEKALGGAGLTVKGYESADNALRAINTQEPAVVMTDIRMPGMDGLALLDQLNSHYPDLPVIIMTAHSDLDSAVSAYKGGAFEYLPKPFDIDEAVALVNRALDARAQQTVDVAPAVLDTATEIIGKAPAMQEVFRAIGRLANSNATVLINGESGTGKELVAQALHQHSARASQPFLALNMAAIPRDLLESELFGHERGAFTGAQNRRAGRFEQANSGTLMLDEIGDMPAELQTRLLRVLADGEFYPVGAHTPKKVDVRIIGSGVGGINETDISLASASDAIVIGFNVRADAAARRAETDATAGRRSTDRCACSAGGNGPVPRPSPAPPPGRHPSE